MEEVSGRIAVTPRSLSTGGHPALGALTDAGYEVVFPAPGRQPTQEEQHAVLPSCVGYLAGVEPVSGELLRRCRDLRVISRNGAGVDNVDLAAAERLGIVVARAAGANAEGVAELALTLMLALVRGVPAADGALKRGEWRRRPGVEVVGRTLGVVGAGQIGRRVCELGLAVGMQVLAFDPYAPDDSLAAGVRAVGLDELLGGSDIVSLHCPPGDRPLVDDAALQLMRPGAHLVNTARAALVDESAVLRALESGRLAGFATDVFATEPPETSSLFGRIDVVVTPHIGGYTTESVDRATVAAVENLLTVLRDSGTGESAAATPA